MLDVLSFCARERALTSFNTNNLTNFSGEKKYNEAFWDDDSLRIHNK